MNVLVVSGIWPPDVGGPASHAPALADFLRERGHGVEVVTTASAEPAARAYPVRWVDRAAPKGLLHARVVRLIAARARAADVVYATSMASRSALATALAGTPLVVKAAGDVAYERSRRLGLFRGDLDEFQRAGGPVVRAFKAARSAALGRAAAVVFPSGYLRGLALGWGLDAERLHVVPNPAPPLPPLRDNVSRVPGAFAFAGRLTAAKSLEVAFRAIAAVDGATLDVAGDGEERARLEAAAGELGVGDRVRFLGSQTRERVFDLFRAAEACVLSSTWENFPHVVVEALAVGTPVVATAVGGVAEVVEDGQNGLLVAPGDAHELAGALRRILDEPGLRERLAAAAAPSVADYGAERIHGRLEELLRQAAR